MSAGLAGRPALRLGKPSEVGGHSARTPDSKAGPESVGAVGLQNAPDATLMVGEGRYVVRPTRCDRITQGGDRTRFGGLSHQHEGDVRNASSDFGGAVQIDMRKCDAILHCPHRALVVTMFSEVIPAELA